MEEEEVRVVARALGAALSAGRVCAVARAGHGHMLDVGDLEEARMAAAATPRAPAFALPPGPRHVPHDGVTPTPNETT